MNRLVCFGLLCAFANVACEPRADDANSSSDRASNTALEEEGGMSLLEGHADFLKNFELDPDAKAYRIKSGTPDGVIAIAASSQVPEAYRKYAHSNGMIYLVFTKAPDPSAALPLAGVRIDPLADVTPIKDTPDDLGPTQKPLKHLVDNPEFQSALARVNTRVDFYKASGINTIADAADIPRAQRFVELIDEIKTKLPEEELAVVYKEIHWRLEKTGVLAPNGLISFLNGKNAVSIREVYQANFAKFNPLVEEAKLSPAQLWELERVWPWPSDHLPAVSEVRLTAAGGNVAIQAGTMNLLKQGFDDNRLQTSQGLGAQLASRYLYQEEAAINRSPNIRPSAARNASTIPSAPNPRPQWRILEPVTKDWEIADIRRRSQNAFIEKQIVDGKVDLLGLNELSSAQALDVKAIASRHNLELITTPSARKTRDTVTGRVDTDLLDNGGILINLNKYERLDEPVVSSYIDPKTKQANKHITSVLVKDRATSQTFLFTNTHADFGQIDALVKHQAALTSKYGSEIPQIVVGDMNAAATGVLSALQKGAGTDSLSVQYSQNTPGHVGFAKGHEGSVVDYDQVFVISRPGLAGVKEVPSINAWHRDYAAAFKREFEAKMGTAN